MIINLEFDEAAIIKDCLEGLSKKEIRKQILHQATQTVISRVAEKIASQFVFNPGKKDILNLKAIVEQDINKRILSKVKETVHNKIERASIGDMVDEYLTNMIEEYFEYSPVTIEFKVGKKSKIVDVLGEKKAKR